MFAALQCLHGFCQSRADLGAVQQGRIKGVREEFGGSHGHRPKGDTHTLHACSQKGSGQAHQTVWCHFAAGLGVQPEEQPPMRRMFTLKQEVSEIE